MFRRPILGFGFILGWMALCGVILFLQRFHAVTTVSFQIAVREAAADDGLIPCFYYDTGRGFSETEKTCFEYNLRPVNQFQTYQVILPTRRTVRRVRFQPLREDGVVALRQLAVGRYRYLFTPARFRVSGLNLEREFGHTLYPLHESRLSIEGESLVARLSTGDPYFMLSDRLDRQTAIDAGAVLRAVAAAFLICIGAVVLIMFIQWTGIPELAECWLGPYAPRLVALVRAAAVGAFAAFLGSIVGTKVFAVATSAIRFARPISLTNLLAAPAEETAIGLLTLMVVWILIAADNLCAGRRWTPVRLFLFGLQLLSTIVLVLLTLFEVLCGYIFWEWGAFVDGSLIGMAIECPTPNSLHYYLTRAPAAVAALAIVALGLFGIFAFRTFRRRGIPNQFVIASASVAAVWSLAAVSPFRAPEAYDPSVPSPIVLALSYGPDVSEGLDPKVVAPGAASFYLPARRPVPATYQRYHGSAAGQDVIMVVLESVRRANVSLYGYSRETTPNLNRLSHHAMVFSNVYVAQPRSCKTMESLTLGTYPDPRKSALSWDSDRILGRPTFWGTLAHDGYRAYLGVNANPEFDGFAPFMKAAMGRALERTVGTSDLVARYGDVARPVRSMGNDTVLVDDFLQWYGARKGPTAALIWFAGAHHPYWATTEKFPEHDVVDQYDNCIYSADQAVGHLIAGIEKTGRHPLVLIFGDHGETFGEHAGDQFHGTYLYSQSVRIPMMLYSPTLFPERQDFDGRISMKDVPATLLYLLGHNEQLGQSEVAFSKQPDDIVYMSTVYGDFKLGVVAGPGPEKFMYLPSKSLAYLFDLSKDRDEQNNLVTSRPPEEIRLREQELTQWYFYQIAYLDKLFPRPEATSIIQPR